MKGKQKQLIDLQTTAIDSLGNHLVFTHDCDLPLCDNANLIFNKKNQ